MAETKKSPRPLFDTLENVIILYRQCQTAQPSIFIEEGGGSFYLFSADDTDIQRILADNHASQTLKDQNENINLWQDAGPLFCLFLLPFILLILREKVS